MKKAELAARLAELEAREAARREKNRVYSRMAMQKWRENPENRERENAAKRAKRVKPPPA